MAAAVIVIDRPALEPVPEGFVPLPAHQLDVESRRCVFCGEVASWDSYREYVEWFYREEWEGERNHHAEEQEVWEWIVASCLPQLYTGADALRYLERSPRAQLLLEDLESEGMR